MKNGLLLVLSLFFLFGSLKAQPTSDGALGRNGIYAEYYTLTHAFSSGHVSLNYERAFGKNNKTCLRLGVYPDYKTTVSFPLTFSWILFPSKNHHLELGLGAVVRIEHYREKYYRDIPAAMFPIMYRYQRKKGLFFRGGANIFYSWPVLATPSFSVGYRF